MSRPQEGIQIVTLFRMSIVNGKFLGFNEEPASSGDPNGSVANVGPYEDNCCRDDSKNGELLAEELAKEGIRSPLGDRRQQWTGGSANKDLRRRGAGQ